MGLQKPKSKFFKARELCMLLKTEISTSQGIAKALKGPGLSCGEKIDTAVTAWEMSSIYFPHKDEFLLDWLSSMLVKPPTKKKEENPQLDERYWKLLSDLLRHYVNSKASDRIPTIRVPLILSFSAAFQNFQETNGWDAQKVISLYRSIQDCLQLLSQPALAFAYRPAMDQLFTTFENLIQVIDGQMIIDGSECNQLLVELMRAANIIIPNLESYMLTSANQRKTFSTLTGKSFLPIIRVYFGVSKSNDQAFVEAKKSLDQLFQNGLFHADTILEYPTVLQTLLNSDNSAAKNQSYVKKLFDELGLCIRQSQNPRDVEAALYILSPLFAMFVQSYRKKRNALTLSNVLKNVSSMDINRTVEFGFFQAMYNILIDATACPNASLEALNNLLQNMLDMNIYHATNDTVAKEQHAVLSGVTEMLFKGLTDKERQGVILRGLCLLLEINDSLIEQHMSDLWPYMLDPMEAAEKESCDLAKAILNTFAKSRQIGEYLQSFIEALNAYGEDKIEYFLRKPMFSREFLNEFSTCVYNNVPPTQALPIFQIFVDHISQSGVAEQPSKKRKTSTTEHTSSQRSHRLALELLCQFLLAIRLTPQQKLAFCDSLSQVAINIIMERLDINNSTDGIRMAIPVLQLHQALLNTFSDIYFNLLDGEFKNKLATYLHQITAISSKQSSNTSLTAFLFSINATFQHVYYCLLSDLKPSAVTLEDLINGILSMVLPKIATSSSWNGRIMDLDKKNIGTACWKILTEDWLPTISTLVSPQHMNDITCIVVSNIHSNDQKPGEISVHGINMVLLRSAEFYELVNLRECTFKVLFAAFTSNISLLAKESKHSEILAGLAEALQDSSPRIQPLVQKALPLFQIPSMEQASKVSSNIVVLNLFVQLEKLHLFPMEYFNKFQRQHLLLTMVLTERLFSFDGSDACERNRLALLCRSFAYKLIRYRGEVGFLVGDVAFLQWWIKSTATLYVDEDTNIDAHKLYQNVVKTTVLLEKMLLSKLIEEANAGKQNSIDAISSCKIELKSIFLEEKRNASNKAPVQLDFIIALVEVLNAQRSARAKRNREATQYILNLGDLQDELYKYVISNCHELKQTILSFMDAVKQTSGDADGDRFMNTSQCVVSFSPILALSHQLLRQHHANSNVKGGQISNLLVPILSVISPCLKYLQMYISTQHSSEEKVLAKLLGVCGEMAITLCSAVPELQNNDVTQRAVAFVWYVYEIAHSHDEVECKSLVDKAFSDLIPTLSQEQFTDVLHCIIQKSGLEYQSEAQVVQDTIKIETVLHFLWLLMNHCSPDQRKPFREQISSVVIMISNVMEKALSPAVLKQSLVLFADIANDQSIGLRAYDISLIIAGITQLRSPNLPTALKLATTKQDANDIFEGIFKVLSGILKNRRQQLVQVITPFTAILETLVHCFRSLHPSVAISTRKRKQDNKKRMLQDQTFSLLTDHAPLNEMCARSYARLLNGLGDQGATNTANTTSGKSHNLAKAFSKHSPYILAEYLSVQADPISTISLPALKSALRPGLFSLLDICGEHERDMLMAAIDTSQKMLLKTLYADWAKTHRYTGR